MAGVIVVMLLVGKIGGVIALVGVTVAQHANFHDLMP